MSVVIRFTRGGKKKHPFYRIVAADSRSARDGKFLEKIGTYDPNPEKALVSLNRQRFDYWVKNGAQVSAAVKGAIKQVSKTDA